MLQWKVELNSTSALVYSYCGMHLLVIIGFT